MRVVLTIVGCLKIIHFCAASQVSDVNCKTHGEENGDVSGEVYGEVNSPVLNEREKSVCSFRGGNRFFRGGNCPFRGGIRGGYRIFRGGNCLFRGGCRIFSFPIFLQTSLINKRLL